MNARLLTAARLLRRGLSLCAALLFLALLAVSCSTYLLLKGDNLRLLHTLTQQLAVLLADQRTEHLVLTVHAAPETGRLEGTATLTVRSLAEARRHFYFLLNDSLHVRDVRARRRAGSSQPAIAYRFWLVTVVDVGVDVARDETVELTFRYDGHFASGTFSTGATLGPQGILLAADHLWYPSDVQGFFTADVTLSLPAALTVVHNGHPARRAVRGDIQELRWSTERPVGGLALVAGQFQVSTRQTDDTTYRVYLPPTLQLDAGRVLSLMAAAHRLLVARYGPSGFREVTLFVSRDLRRGFNDGSGVMGLSSRYFRAGDYGFALIAHEIAHNWWGGTVAAHWLSPGTGGEWIVEGLAELSSLVATEAEYGPDALTRRLAAEFFDPARQATLAEMSVLDNTLAEARSRDTIYRKGAYVAFMLRRILGDEKFFEGLRRFIERFRHQHATERDLQQVLQEVSGHDLEGYFTEWVRSEKLADLSLDGTNQNEVAVSNLGSATIASPIDLWTFKKDGAEPVRTTVRVGDRVPIPPDADTMLLDPLLAFADVQRQNNRYPRRNDPVYVATSDRGEIALSRGDVLPWTRTALTTVDPAGRTLYSWDFERGFASAPRWSPDGSRLIVSFSEAETSLPAIVTLSTQGTRRTVSHGTSPAVRSDGVIVAGHTDRLIAVGTDGRVTTLVRRSGEVLDGPLPAPSGQLTLYAAARGNRVDLRALDGDGNDRVIMAAERDRMVYRWAPDASRLYAIVGGTWDWQIWALPLTDEPVQVLASGAAAIADLAPAPDGGRLAFTAAPSLDYPINRAQLFLMHLGDRQVQTIDIPGADLGSLAWADANTLLVIATDVSSPLHLPQRRTLKRVRLPEGTIEDVG
jgi:hypothetical protein